MANFRSWAVLLSFGGVLAVFPLSAGTVGPAAAAKPFQFEERQINGNANGLQRAVPASRGAGKRGVRVKVQQAESVPRTTSVTVPEGTGGELPLLLSGLAGLWLLKRKS